MRVIRVLASAAEIVASVTANQESAKGRLCVFTLHRPYMRLDSSGESDESRAQRHVIGRIGFASN